MSWLIEIYDQKLGQTFDITSRTLSINVNSQLGKQTSEFSLECKDIDSVHYLNEIKIYKDSVLKYAGIIVNQEDYQSGTKKFTSFKCVDWSYILHYRIIAKQYTEEDNTQGKPDLIIKDIVNIKASEFTTNNVKECSNIIQLLRLRYETVFDSLNKLTDFLTDWYWYVDENKDIHFFQNYEEEGPVFDESLNILVDTTRVSYETEELANRVWVLGAKQASSQYKKEYFTGDGQSRIYKLGYEPNYTEAYINGNPANIKLESNDDGQQDFLINKKQKVIYRPDYKSPIANGDIVKFRYRPTVEIVDFFEAPDSINTYGLYERAIKNRDLTDKLEARKFGRAALKRTSTIKRYLSFSTREEVKIGQKVNVKMPSWNIDSDWLVVGVSTSITPADMIHSVELKEVV